MLPAVDGKEMYRGMIGDLLPGELGQRDSLKDAVLSAKQKGSEFLLWVEEDTVCASCQRTPVPLRCVITPRPLPELPHAPPRRAFTHDANLADASTRL